MMCVKRVWYNIEPAIVNAPSGPKVEILHINSQFAHGSIDILTVSS